VAPLEVVNTLRASSRSLVELAHRSEKVQQRALKNTDVYLTWDYLDVYVATSMRNKWEFEETFVFVRRVFGNRRLASLKLRYFDPTQSKCTNPRDKGLLEGLMLKRAMCTIYMVQETDTLGKDSELAATLAQGKPVIAYVPRLEPRAYARRIASHPLEYFKKRLLALTAEGLFEDKNLTNRVAASCPNFDRRIHQFLTALSRYRRKQPLTLLTSLDDLKFKKPNQELVRDIATVLAEAEAYNFERRVKLLRDKHPLAMQVDISSGIANGLLVVRSAQECAKLLHGLITNRLHLAICSVQGDNDLGFTILKESISRSPFRVVTHNERLTNSFWNLFTPAVQENCYDSPSYRQNRGSRRAQLGR